MDQIGIKLADGSFYPILEDGKPGKKNISLTTVKDNQTTVHVDLFRSPSGSMVDAQYIDTLEIDNLNPHVNGDPNLNFDIALDEDGAVSASINDPETGKQSSRTVSLSSLAGKVAASLPSRDSDLSVKDDDEIDEPIEMGHHKDTNDYVKEMEDIFKAPEPDSAEEDKKADSSFEEIVNDISNIGKDADSQEDEEVIGTSLNEESFAFDDFDGGKDAKKDEVAAEPIEEISAEDALPKDAEFVDSTGDEPVDMPDTLGALDAGADQPDFGFKELADSAETGASGSGDGDDAEKTADGDGFEELGTLPDWSTKGLDEGDDENTASNDDNLDEENLELASFDAEGTDDLSEPVVAEESDASSDDTDFTAPEVDAVSEEAPAADDTDFAAPEVDAVSEETAVSDDTDFAAPEVDAVSEETTASDDTDFTALDAGAVADEAAEDRSLPEDTLTGSVPEDDSSDDLGDMDLPSINLFDEQPAVTPEPEKSAADDDPWAGAGAAVASSFAFDDSSDDLSSANDFELPDLGFDDAVTEEADTSFEMPDFSRTTSSSSSAFDDFDSSLSSTSDWPSLDLNDDVSRSSADSSFTPNNMFANLYDKETMEGKSSDGYEDEKRETRIPMIVCIACAVICILCLFFLFIIPTKFNVLRRGDSQVIAMSDKQGTAGRPEGKSSVGGNESQETKSGGTTDAGPSSAGDLIKPAASANVSAPLPKVESVPAKENEIVIASVPSVVVPETPVKNVKKIPDIQYTVVWGDTLWDIANAYYKNPWKYTVLAEYNNLKNPNFIQTGSILLIPAE